jgi:hypothetical protein
MEDGGALAMSAAAPRPHLPCLHRQPPNPQPCIQTPDPKPCLPPRYRGTDVQLPISDEAQAAIEEMWVNLRQNNNNA